MPALAKPRGNQISSSSSCPRDLKMQIPRALTQTNRTIRAIMQKMWTHLKMILRKIIRVAIQKKWRLSLIIRPKTSRQTVKIMQVPRNRSLLTRMQIAARRIKIRKKWPKKKSLTLVWNPSLSRSKMRKIIHQQSKKIQRKYLTKWVNTIKIFTGLTPRHVPPPTLLIDFWATNFGFMLPALLSRANSPKNMFFLSRNNLGN